MAYSSCRVNIQKNIQELLLDLAAKVYQKHTYLITASPLSAMISHKGLDNDPIIELCLKFHKEAEALKRHAEEAYRQRDLLLNGITESIKTNPDLMLGIYLKIPKALGDCDFDVDDSALAAKKMNSSDILDIGRDYPLFKTE